MHSHKSSLKLVTVKIARLPLVCVLFSGCLIAQAAPAKAAPSVSSDTSVALPGNTAGATKPHDDIFIIGVDDLLAINVWKEPDISRAVPVRSDGMISLPLAGDIQASGQTPHQLEIAIAAKLKNFISEPEVTVIVEEIRSQKFNILGEVGRPGSYSLTNSITVLDAIALAGGFRDFAKKKDIYVLRQSLDGQEKRIPFNYKEVIKGKNPAQNIRLQPRDTLVVP